MGLCWGNMVGEAWGGACVVRLFWDNGVGWGSGLGWVGVVDWGGLG